MPHAKHNEGCSECEAHFDTRLGEISDRFESLITHRMSAYESSMMKEIIRGNQLTEKLAERVNSLETALAEYKFGWKVIIFLAVLVVGGFSFFTRIWEFMHTK